MRPYHLGLKLAWLSTMQPLKLLMTGPLRAQWEARYPVTRSRREIVMKTLSREGLAMAPGQNQDPSLRHRDPLPLKAVTWALTGAILVAFWALVGGLVWQP
jgi:hypothetical protein